MHGSARLTASWLAARPHSTRGRSFGSLQRARAGAPAGRSVSPVMGRNVMPLMTMLNGVFEPGAAPTLQEVVLQACVHGWMEGHLAAPGHVVAAGATEDMPAPPFPPRDSDQLCAIVEEVMRRFAAGEEPAAATCALALGWRAGRQAGLDCPGCGLGKPRSAACARDPRGRRRRRRAAGERIASEPVRRRAGGGRSRIAVARTHERGERRAAPRRRPCRRRSAGPALELRADTLAPSAVALTAPAPSSWPRRMRGARTPDHRARADGHRGDRRR